MIARPIRREDLTGKVIDVHSHVGIQIQAAAQIAFPYCSSIEDLYYRQRANGVDASVVFPISPALFFDIPTYVETGRLVPSEHPLSRAPYERENRLMLTELYTFCPEHRDRFMPFISVDPGRFIDEQIEVLRELEQEFPIYGVKIVPVACQSKVIELLGKGEKFLRFFAERDWPILFHVAVSAGEEFSQASDTFQVIDRHPELRYCLAHCLGFDRGFLERADALPNVWVDTSALKIQVELAYQSSSLMTDEAGRVEANYADHVDVMRRLVELYPKTIVWGTDAPYHSYIIRRLQGDGVYADFRLKGTHEQEKAALDALSPAQQAQLNVNTLDFIFGR